MNKFFMKTLYIALFSCGAVHAQDIITLKSGEEMRAKVLEVNLIEVKYKKFENLRISQSLLSPF